MRIIHFLVICALVISAAYVYRIKLDSTVRTERVLRLRADIREERNKIAQLRAEWATLSSPARLQGLAERHTQLRPVESHQFGSMKNLPSRPPRFIKPGETDPIGAMIDVVSPDETTASIPAAPAPATGEGAQ